jgi:NADH dehydrogenase/NADH:ubiquinone oxidoreductase subunit G
MPATSTPFWSSEVDAMITVQIDGNPIEVEPGTTILDAGKQVGVLVPTLCNHEMIEPYGACRVCSVEIDVGGRKKIVTACNYPIHSEMEVFTNSERASRAAAPAARWPCPTTR